uniref:Uncharacterized protein n=1 Tax=Ditylenchus dipsaci TaxID=166011 RepID=A0A915ETS0_9BILA
MDDSEFPDSDETRIYPVDETVETSSKADRLTSTTASSSRSCCAGDEKISPLVVRAVVKPAKEISNQPAVFKPASVNDGSSCSAQDVRRSSEAVANAKIKQLSAFIPASVNGRS